MELEIYRLNENVSHPSIKNLALQQEPMKLGTRKQSLAKHNTTKTAQTATVTYKTNTHNPQTTLS